MSETTNIARLLIQVAAAHPHLPAIKIPLEHKTAGDTRYLTIDFCQLISQIGAWQHLLTKKGVSKGDRTLVMVRPGLPLIASVYALLAIGAVPIVIDPGMGLRSFLKCVQRSQPRALIGIPLAYLLSLFARRSFRSVHLRIGIGSKVYAQLETLGTEKPEPIEVKDTETAAILFTSGSTGAPKGVVYEHGMFSAQIKQIRETYGIQEGEIDLPLLPVFALFNPVLGMTTVIPEIDPRRPASLEPARIVQAIQQQKITNSFGSPTLWAKIAGYCEERNLKLPSLRRVLCAGAPVPEQLWRSSLGLLPNGSMHSPYGATEALPISSICAAEAAIPTLEGAPVGKALSGMTVRIIRISDKALTGALALAALPPGEIGEIIVRGAVVTRSYDGLPEATKRAKVEDGSPQEPSAFWHRMGDAGFLDAEGHLYFCGRVVERVTSEQGTLFTEPVERVFRRHPEVSRCALVGLGEPGFQTPALVVEKNIHSSSEARSLARSLRALACKHVTTERIRIFYFHPKFPLDVRHNAKIHRLSLAKWAASARGFQSDPKR